MLYHYNMGLWVPDPQGPPELLALEGPGGGRFLATLFVKFGLRSNSAPKADWPSPPGP
eukprot:NODE_1529_length_1384_cov_7.317603_g1271_i0.p7 GENE.NODE_1529_length_1384_cov_7.317603_g1271_i0~~NODE_1529_length_1384_cov_7.317603_g1271_i0.p7  ORF type:complete len:58 (+),score=3.50 NODE_1529_length_1384_cov_7.317603_g1271_i0:270-443(+)